MKKSILNLAGAQELSKKEQKTINGGKPAPKYCPDGGFLSGINSCLCNGGGIYIPTTGQCSNQMNTGRTWENATGCCFTF